MNFSRGNKDLSRISKKPFQQFPICKNAPLTRQSSLKVLQFAVVLSNKTQLQDFQLGCLLSKKSKRLYRSAISDNPKPVRKLQPKTIGLLTAVEEGTEMQDCS